VNKGSIDKEQERLFLRYDILTRNSGVGIWEINKEGFTDYMNSSMCEILNIKSPSEMDNLTYEAFFTDESVSLIKNEHKKRSKDISSAYEVELIRKNGEKRNILINGSPLLSKNGDHIGMIGTFTDITEKKKSELELKKSEERFRLLFEKLATPLGISRNGKHLLANEAFLKLFKYESQEAMVGKSVLDQIAASDREKILQFIAARTAGDYAPMSYEVMGLKTDQTEFPLHADISYIELPDGMATVVSILDISEQKSAEAALRSSEAKFRGLFESNMVGITFSNGRQQIVEANQKFLDIIQYTEEDLKNGFLQWSHLTPEEYLDLDKAAVQEFMQKGFISPYEKEYIRKDGSRIPVVIGASVLGQPGLGVGFVIDISELKRSKEENYKLANELSTFLYMASHDLKGPLASVIGLTNIARNDVEDLKALEYINLIQECTLKLDRSLMNFLEIIKIKNVALDHKRIEFKALVEEIISSLKHQVSFMTTEFIVSDTLSREFYSDESIIRSIVQNLVENSVKYQTRLRSPVVKIELKEDSKNMFIVVDDNGRGIDPSIIDKIFNIFYRGDISSKGSGLGLYIVKNAAEKLGGSIKVQTKPEGGSTFTLVLPITTENPS
jgi:PAS domain S-box-containing protein